MMHTYETTFEFEFGVLGERTVRLAYTFYPGHPGTRWEPPEDPEHEVQRLWADWLSAEGAELLPTAYDENKDFEDAVLRAIARHQRQLSDDYCDRLAASWEDAV
jgi:hypothetical protein